MESCETSFRTLSPDGIRRCIMAKILVTLMEDKGWDSRIDGRFGRASFFGIIDEEGGLHIRPNPYGQAAHGAGTGAAGYVAQEKVTDLITTQVGPKAWEALSAIGVNLWSAPEGSSVREVYGKWQKSELPRQQGAQGGRNHW